MSRLGKGTWAIVVAIAVLAFIGGYALNSGHDADETARELVEEHADHGLEASVDEQGNIVWTCSMHPQIQLPEPGQCPICFMDLIPIEKTDDSASASYREITLTEQARKLAEITVEPVRRLDVAVETRMVGKVDYDETRVKSITAWTGGRIDRMYVDYTGSLVKRGQAMVSVYSPELLTAQAELIQAVKARKELAGSGLELVKSTAERTERAAREKLRLLGLTSGQIERIASGGEPSDHVTLVAPMSGVVLTKDVVEGQYVQTGSRIYSIADLSVLWVVLEAYESDLPWIGMGQEVEFQTDAHPGTVFSGKVVYIDPLVNEKTRTVRVRLEVDNSDKRLKPGMLVRAVQKSEEGMSVSAESPLVIPATAPLITGKRAVVYVADDKRDGVYTGREVVLGPKAQGYYVVASGLEEGELVVTNGSFKIDSALQIVAKPSMMTPSTGKGVPDQELPRLFLSQLRLLDASYQAVEEAVESQDLAATHLAFATFGKDVRLVDGSGLEGQAALAWKELSMLLANDAILGAEADDLERLRAVHDEMSAHYARLREAFRLDSVQDDTLEVPQSFRVQLGEVFAHYEPLSEALAADDMQAAQQAAAQLAGALQEVDMTVLGGPAHDVWMDALHSLSSGLEHIRTAPDIAEVRVGFEPVSIGMVQAVTKLGIELSGGLYELKCPMAFEDKGATWLQRDPDIRNPYFGAMMLKCGEVTQQLK